MLTNKIIQDMTKKAAFHSIKQTYLGLISSPKSENFGGLEEILNSNSSNIDY